MKVLIALLLVALIVNVRGADRCRSVNDCNLSCDSTEHAVCIRIGLHHECHCADGPPSGSCSDADGCPACSRLSHQKKHCVDGRCLCLRW